MSPGSCWSPLAATPTGSAPNPPSRCCVTSPPLPASSGKTRRHRLNRGGDWQANAALYRVVPYRLRWTPVPAPTPKRRTAEGLSKKEIIRCLKRLIAREIYYVLQLTTITEPAP